MIYIIQRGAFGKCNRLQCMNKLVRNALEHRLDGHVENWMAPAWQDIKQRRQYKSAVLQPGMRQDKLRRCHDQPIHRQQVEIQRAGGIPCSANPACRCLNAVQGLEQVVWLGHAGQQSDPIDEGWLI